MAISFSRPDPASPASVAGASFPTSRRGFDQDEVRDFLRMVSAELSRLVERERFLERELQTVRHRSPMAPAELDENRVAELLGEETARILQSAREAAVQIRNRAEDAAQRLLREATDEAARIREDASLESARVRSDAETDARTEREMAKQQGREMVEEARAYRERVLADLVRRRDLARQQIEQMVHGRERLLQAFERARLAAVDVVSEVGSVGEEPAEFVNLAPSTGPVPLMVKGSPRPEPAVAEPEAAVEPAMVEPEAAAEAEPVEPEVDAVEPDPVEPAAMVVVDDVELEPAAVESVQAPEPDDGGADVLPMRRRMGHPVLTDSNAARQRPFVADDDAPHLDLVGDVDDDGHDEHDDEDAHDDRRGNVVSLFAGEIEPPPTPVDDLFAKLRAASAEMIARDTAAQAAGGLTSATDTDAHDDESTDAGSPFGRRDEALVPLIVAMGRKLKRVLADEQNEVLDRLRRGEHVGDLADVVGEPMAHLDRYRTAIDAEIIDAAVAGGHSLSDGPSRDIRTAVGAHDVLAPVATTLNDDIVVPLRERLTRSIEHADGDGDELSNLVRAVYREWKTQRIDEYVDDLARLAYGRGAFAALSPDARVCWRVDPNGPACPDAEDNALGGVVAAGDEFPTGHTHPPAHDGCRCVLTRIDG